MKISKILLSCSVCLLVTSCNIDSADGNSSSSDLTTIDVVLAGIVADGYIKNATVCLDLDLNGECSTNERAINSDENGTFNFGTYAIKSGEVVSYVSSGGVDTATGKNFEGRLRAIQEINATVYSYVTPITDLIAKTFLNNIAGLSESKEMISRAFPIHIDIVDNNPLAYAGVFARAQEIQQLKGLLLATFETAKGLALTSSEKIQLQESIKSAIVNDIESSVEPNIPNIITLLEEYEDVAIAEDVKTFVNEQQAYIKVDLESFSSTTGLSSGNLNEYQVALEEEADKAYGMIDGTGEALASFALDIDIFEEDDNDTVPPDDIEVPSENIIVSFDGVSVDGYISGAEICIDSDYSGACSTDELKTTTDDSGAFSFSSINLKKNTLFPIISKDGIDSYTQRPYSGELKNIIVSEDLANEDVVISTLTDFMSLDYLNNSVKNKSTLIESKNEFASKMGISTEELLSDPALDVSLFMQAVYLEHMKRFITLVLPSNSSQNIIKEAILSQILDSGYTSFSIIRVLDAVEISLGINIATDDREFVESILRDIKAVLDEVEGTSEVQSYTLSTFQRMLEDKLEVNYTTKSYTALEMTPEELLASEYEKDEAIYDSLACEVNSINKNTLIDTDITTERQSDSVNAITIKSNEDNITMLYRDLALSKTARNVTVYDNEDRFSFSYDEAWIEKNVDIYLETSKNQNGFLECYRAKLNSTSAGDIELEKVFRYSY